MPMNVSCLVPPTLMTMRSPLFVGEKGSSDVSDMPSLHTDASKPLAVINKCLCHWGYQSSFKYL